MLPFLIGHAYAQKTLRYGGILGMIIVILDFVKKRNISYLGHPNTNVASRKGAHQPIE